MKKLALRLWREEEGQDLIEYALLMVLLALAVTAALGPLATALMTAYNNATSNLTTAST